MGDTTITKVDSSHSPRGSMGQKYLASGIGLSMRLWDGLEAGDETKPESREYETVGYVISGSAELELESQKVTLKAGDSWVVPKGSKHSYRVLDRFTAVEATHPPAQAHGRDD